MFPPRVGSIRWTVRVWSDHWLFPGLHTTWFVSPSQSDVDRRRATYASWSSQTPCGSRWRSRLIPYPMARVRSTRIEPGFGDQFGETRTGRFRWSQTSDSVNRLGGLPWREVKYKLPFLLSLARFTSTLLAWRQQFPPLCAASLRPLARRLR